MAFVLSLGGCDHNECLIFLCLLTFDDHHSSNYWKNWNTGTLEIIQYYLKKIPNSQVLLHALNKGNSNQAAANRNKTDNIYWETLKKNLEVILLLFFNHNKKNYLLLEREEKQSQEINKGRAQLTIMKWNKVQRLT